MIRTESIYATYEQVLSTLINQFLYEYSEIAGFKVISIQHGGFYPIVEGEEGRTGEAALIVYEVEE